MNKDLRNKAISWHNEAIGLVQKDPMTAYRLLCSAVTVDPSCAASWYQLGCACADLIKNEAAVACFRRVLTLPEGNSANGDADRELHVKARVNLGHRLLNMGAVAEAEVETRKALAALEADPTLDQEGRAFAWTNLSLVLSIQGRTEEALAYAQEAYRQSQEPIIETGLAFAYLYNGDYAEGLKHFEARFAYKESMNQFLSYPYDRWDGKPTEKTLLVAPDQGLGDTLSFARFISPASRRVGKLIFRVQPELVRMLTQGVAYLKNVQVEPTSTIFPVADVWCPVVSLPAALGMTTEEIAAQPQSWTAGRTETPTEGWKDQTARLHIGIAYAGAAMNDTDRWRSIPVHHFLELHRVPGVALYSLQVGDRVADLHAACMAGLCRDLAPWLRDAMDTAGIIRELDLVITCESFVGHLCAALGKACWVLVARRAGDWRVGRRGDKALWYPKTRVFRQGEDGEWGPVFREVVEALEERLAGR